MISGASDEELDIAIARADVLLELQPKIDELKKENQELKKQLEEWIDLLNMFKNQQKEFIAYLKNEKDRLAREVSPIYEDDLGTARLVNEDIFEEVNEILSKYKEIIGIDNENN